jgi:hypothetical protein
VVDQSNGHTYRVIVTAGVLRKPGKVSASDRREGAWGKYGKPARGEETMGGMEVPPTVSSPQETCTTPSTGDGALRGR